MIDRDKLLELAKYTKEFGVISTLPNLDTARAELGRGRQDRSRRTAGGTKFLSLRLDGKFVTTLPAGKYTFVVTDSSKTANFHLKGPGVNKKTSLAGTGRSHVDADPDEGHLRLHLGHERLEEAVALGHVDTRWAHGSRRRPPGGRRGPRVACFAPPCRPG